MLQYLLAGFLKLSTVTDFSFKSYKQQMQRHIRQAERKSQS